jgi:serine/threonine protein kinase
MPVATAEHFWIALRASRLFTPGQVEDLERLPDCAEAEPPALAQTLVERGLLSPYQAEQVISGHGRGLVLGQYRLLDRLGAGGMGQVFKAEHILMKRVVALKVIAACATRAEEDMSLRHSTWHAASTTPFGESGQGFDPLAIDRFHQEVQAAAHLRHPNIVTAFDAAEADGVHFLVMEYVDGLDMGRLIAESGPLPIALACEYIRQAALGLQHAHEHGLVHRDIKPSNLLVAHASGQRPPASEDDENTPPPARRDLVKILDLGLARVAAPPTRPPDGEDLNGTPDFMAPEVANDPRAADIRSDLYSLGCTFYFLLTGQVPYPGGTWTEKLLQHRLDLVMPVRRLRPEIPAEIAEIVQRLMAKDPADRCQTPADLANELGAWLTSQAPRRVAPPSEVPGTLPVILPPRETAPPTTRPALSWPFAVMAAVTVGLLAALLLREWGRPAASPRLADARQRLVQTALMVQRPAATPFVLEGKEEAFANLIAALAASTDGDTIRVDGNGPFAMRPVDIHARRLTIKAGDGFQPRLKLVADGDGWRPLIATDSPLTLQGLELCGDETQPVSTGSSTLVNCVSAPLRLLNCRLHAPRGSALVVCRCPPLIEMHDCTLVGEALALSVEAGADGVCDLQLTGNTLRLSGNNAAAISLWARETQPVAPVRLRLEKNTFQAGRGIALNSLRQGIEVTAWDNDFTFRDALLSYVGFPAPDSWRRLTAWHGRDNQFRGHGNWLTVNGAQAGISDYEQWRTMWEADHPVPVARTSNEGREARDER